MRFKKKPVIIEATQWFKNGDHPQDGYPWADNTDGDPVPVEGKVVRYHRVPNPYGQVNCNHCGGIMHKHGWVDTFEGGHVVCPGDWIITGVKGEHYPCKPDIFEMTYEPAE